MYKQSIIVFGMVIPGIALLAVLIVMWSMIGGVETTYQTRVEALKQTKLAQLQEKSLGLKLSPRRGQMEYWAEHLEQDATQGLNESLDDIFKGFEGNQLSLTLAKRPSGKGVLGKVTEASTSVFNLSFDGGYGPMQQMMAELELRMPQLVLEGLSIEPGKHTGKGYQRALKFDVTYMAWAKSPEVVGAK
ncbi:MAG: type II secretion system protein M [Candidatus Marinimicrobia bacterium]|nr:type II secretion system protein M [Candidatus Neomarinimicrobiota bacterium]